MRRVMSLFLPRWPTDRLSRSGPFGRALPRSGERSGERDAKGEKGGEGQPFVTALTIGNRRLVAAVGPAAAAAGLTPGLPLADAQAFVPSLTVVEADPTGDAAALRRLAEWCGRYSPWTVPDGADGILLDITGCAHLAGGEERLAADLLARIAQLGFAVRAAIADTPGAAWAAARFGDAERLVLAPGAARMALAALPVAALRLPAEIAIGLERLGLKRIGEVLAMPRAALAQRFGEGIARRLDQVLGAAGEPVSPLTPRAARRSRLAFAEPISAPEDLVRAMRHLVEDLCSRLAGEGVGARRLELACYRVDGRVERAAIGTARPSRDPRHLARLLAEKLETIDPDLGIEDMVLAAPLAETLAAAQLTLRRLSPPVSSPASARALVPSPALIPSPHPALVCSPAPALVPSPLGERGRERGTRSVAVLGENAQAEAFPLPTLSPRGEGIEDRGARRARKTRTRSNENHTDALATLIDRLGNRLGLDRLCRPEPRESHLPERAVAWVPVLDPSCKTHGTSGIAGPDIARPVRLLAPPEPVEVTAPVPDDPPVMFRWRRVLHRVRRADGPERIAGEWWRDAGEATRPGDLTTGDPADIRDYYRVEDETGCRFWLYRAGLYAADRPPRWFIHGVFA